MVGEFEDMVLSQMILTPAIVHETILTKEMFSDSENRLIFSSIVEIVNKGIRPDLITVKDFCTSVSSIKLARLTDLAPSSANWGYYEKKIVSEWKKRSLYKLGQILTDSSEEYEILVQVIESTLAELSYATGRKSVEKISDHLMAYINELKGRYENRGVIAGLATGINNLDVITQGLRPRLLYVIGGRPSQGKSALGLNIAAHIATKEKKPVGILSLESGRSELIGRLLSSEACVDGRNIISGYLSSANMSNIVDAGGKLFNAPLYFWDQPNGRLLDVLSVSRVMKRQHKIELLVLDYLQIVTVPGAVDRRDAAAQTSMAMKQLARELEIPVLVLAQLNRDSENRRPSLSDFQWSSQIEQDADVAILLFHKMSGDEENQIIDKSWLLVDKCRDGRRGSVPIVFRQEYVKFEEAR